jgi:hypothetical protein
VASTFHQFRHWKSVPEKLTPMQGNNFFFLFKKVAKARLGEPESYVFISHLCTAEPQQVKYFCTLFQCRLQNCWPGEKMAFLLRNNVTKIICRKLQYCVWKRRSFVHFCENNIRIITLVPGAHRRAEVDQGLDRGGRRGRPVQSANLLRPRSEDQVGKTLASASLNGSRILATTMPIV